MSKVPNADDAHTTVRRTTVPERKRATSSAIIQADDSEVVIGGFKITPVGIQFNNTTHEEWQALPHIIKKIQSASTWMIGDWLVYGETQYGKTYEEMSALTSLKVTTLHNIAYVARSIQFSSRNENLSFKHHMLVASMAPDDQKAWLEYAEANRLTTAALSDQIRGLDTGNATPIKIWRSNSNKMLKAVQRAFSTGQEKDRNNALDWIKEQRRMLDEFEKRLS